MAPAYLSIWKRCLQELQHLPEVVDPAEEHAVAGRVNAGLQQWLLLPGLSPSAWKVLVLDLKVRLHNCSLIP